VIKLEPKGSNFGRTWFKLIPREPFAQILKCQNRTGGSLKKENWTTLVYTSVVWFLTFMKNL
jgi:hypothetical protein